MTPPADRLRVMYLSHAPGSVYDIVREAAADGVELLFLDADSDEERLRKLGEADVVIVAAYPLTARMLEAAPRLRLVHHQGVGYQDTVDLDALAARPVRLALTPEGTTIGVAEHAVLLALAVYRRLAFLDAELRAGRWHINTFRSQARELRGKVIGYVGMGRIGQAAARRFRAFETRGLYHDPNVTSSAAEHEALGLAPATLETVLAEADVVSLHLPLTPATRHLIDAAALARMKRDAILLNTARGPLVDEAALVAALRAGTIAGAGLDVFETEPPPPDSPLLGMRNVVVTPHVSAATRDAMTEKMHAIFANIARFVRGEPLRNEVVLEATS